jgi:predicted PurR-regulated permease PerM
MIIFFIIVILIIISILYLVYYLSNKKIEEFSNYSEKINTNQDFNNNLNNLVKNGNFENGKDITNQISKSGYNKIISKKNPGKTSYVLEQKKNR